MQNCNFFDDIDSVDKPNADFFDDEQTDRVQIDNKPIDQNDRLDLIKKDTVSAEWNENEQNDW